MTNGYIKIGRNITQNWIWSDPVKLKWWIDLLLMAAYEKTTVKIGNRMVDCERGQIITTLSELSKRWNVSRDKVRHFLTSCSNRAQIAHSSRTDFTQITICKYDSYQDTPHTLRTDCAHFAHSTYLNTINKEKNIINNILKENDNCHFSATSDDVAVPIIRPHENTNFSQIAAMYNDICRSYPKIEKMTEKRKVKLRNRIKEMGGNEKAKEMFRVIFQKMEQSAFLKGDNKRSWRANFDWLIANEDNYTKVLENFYENKTQQNGKSNDNRANNARTTKQERDAMFADHIAKKLYGNAGA